MACSVGGACRPERKEPADQRINSHGTDHVLSKHRGSHDILERQPADARGEAEMVLSHGKIPVEILLANLHADIVLAKDKFHLPRVSKHGGKANDQPLRACVLARAAAAWTSAALAMLLPVTRCRTSDKAPWERSLMQKLAALWRLSSATPAFQCEASEGTLAGNCLGGGGR